MYLRCLPMQNAYKSLMQGAYVRCLCKMPMQTIMLRKLRDQDFVDLFMADDEVGVDMLMPSEINNALYST